ncbi:hypothetical protein F5Y06DRAFT_256948 [Hypoxylon sp. FL0890]|nr:hypothetical protein F5Y06DRAFT_256948 [Hypoxylon sp. FL0890]
MPGQFPVSSWLADKLNIPDGDTESILLPEAPVKPQITHFDHCHLNSDWKVNLDSDLSSSLNFIDPRQGCLSLPPKEPNTQLLGVHSEKVTPESTAQTQFMCSTCGMSFSSQGKLNGHNRRHEKKHNCTQCGRRFSEVRDLRRHVQSMHQQLWTKCPQCGKKLKRREDNLRRHMTQYCKRKQYNLGR